LAKAVEFFYQQKVSKDYRTLMKGKHWVEVSEENKEKVKLAGITDARWALKLFKDYSADWPEHERRVSRLSRQQGWAGLRVDLPELQKDIELLSTLKWEAERLIPWTGKSKNMSYEALVEECKKAGIEAPASTAMTSDECEAWEDKYGERFPWIDAMRNARRANALLKKCETMLARVRKEDGRMPYQNKYFGAHTGRWGDGGEDSGKNKDSGFNTRNLPRAEMFGEDYFLGKKNADGTREKADGARFAHLWIPGKSHGVNLRHRIIPAEGCHFPLADLSQIEPRCLWRAVGDWDSLAYCRKGMSPYEALMRSKMGYTGGPVNEVKERDPEIAALYQLAKAQVLALGYGAGYLKFIQMAPIYVDKKTCARIFSAPISDDDIANFEDYLKYCKIGEWNARWHSADATMRCTYVNSWKIVMGFRFSNPLICGKKGIWKRLDNAVKAAVGDDFEMKLPSGRALLYRKIAVQDGDVTGVIMKYGRPTRVKLYGGLLTENYIQAVARDVFVECLLRLDDVGHWVAAHVHDEAIPEVSLSVTTEEIEGIMAQSPSFWPDLPVSSSCKSHMHYTK
jgi:hypothetical protein